MNEDDDTIEMPEESKDRCAECGKRVHGVLPAGVKWSDGSTLIWKHWDREANADHDAWVRA